MQPTAEPSPILPPVTGAPYSYRFPHWMTVAALALGLSVELLFDGHPLGVSFPIWASLCVLALGVLAWRESVEPARDSLWLAAPILFLAAMAFFRLEPMTVFVDVVLVLGLFAIWVRLFRSGRLMDQGWIDLAIALIWVPLEAWVRTWPVAGASWSRLVGERGRRSRLLGLVRGLLLALPVVAVFAGLLSAADLVFSDYLEEVLHWLHLDRIVELIGRSAVVIISGLFGLGALAAALRDPGERRLVGEKRPVLLPFIGITESLVILGAVDLLFLSFVVIQLAYLFGGQANITATGYTYAEYARRGFGELVAVSALTLGLILGLSAWTHREAARARSGFLAASGVLVGLVAVILASALERLLLYEQAYGFTRLRTYTHVAIVWMGVLFAGFLALLLLGRLRRFATLTGAAALGFAATLSLLNVDAFIVRRNLTRWEASRALDVDYLASLTDDATPALVSLARTAPPALRRELLPMLSCRRAMLDDRQERLEWPSLHWARVQAAASLASLEEELAAYPVRWVPYDEQNPDWGQWQVEVESGEQPCRQVWVD